VRREALHEPRVAVSCHNDERMTDDGRAKLAELETRLARLAANMRATLPDRARELREAASQLATDEADARTTIGRLAHRLRGSAASFGAASLTEPATELETSAKTLPPTELARAAEALATLVERAADAPPTETPIAITTGAESPTPISGVYRKPLAHVRILAIDDDEQTRRLLRMTLVNLGGADAWIESEAARFLERIATEHFDIVIVDAMMPEVDGRACLERIAAMPIPHGETRFYLFSASSPAELGWSLPVVLDVRRLTKPFRPAELLRAIDE
jgi:CheY-like chemotaxis protein